MPDKGERHLAAELQGIGTMTSMEDPEWKTATSGKGLSYGHRSKLSIVEQRKSLPIYKLKTELQQAIAALAVKPDPHKNTWARRGKPPEPCFHCGGDHWADSCTHRDKLQQVSRPPTVGEGNGARERGHLLRSPQAHRGRQARPGHRQTRRARDPPAGPALNTLPACGTCKTR